MWYILSRIASFPREFPIEVCPITHYFHEIILVVHKVNVQLPRNFVFSFIRVSFIVPLNRNDNVNWQIGKTDQLFISFIRIPIRYVYNNTMDFIRLLDLIVNTELIVIQKIRRDCVISYESSASYELQLALQRNLHMQIRLISVLSKLTVILFCMKYADYASMYYRLL